jgi:hypothetical protein
MKRFLPNEVVHMKSRQECLDLHSPVGFLEELPFGETLTISHEYTRSSDRLSELLPFGYCVYGSYLCFDPRWFEEYDSTKKPRKPINLNEEF